MSDWIRDISRSFAKRLVQEAEMRESLLSKLIAREYNVQREWDALMATPSYCERFVRPVVIMEDEIIHTDDRPECDDPDCICHWERATQNEADIYGTHAPDCRCAWCSEEV